MKLLFVMLITISSTAVLAGEKVTYRKTQDVSFDQQELDGVVRNPDGSYVTQKRGIDFVPLYRVRHNFDENIKESAFYIK